MKKIKILIVAAAMCFMLGAVSSASASGHPLLMGVTDGQEAYYILVKFDQNQFSLQDAQAMSQDLGQMTGATAQWGYQTVMLTPYELYNAELGDADLVKGAMKQLGWTSVFMDLSYRQAPVAGITNLNMDMSLFYPYFGQEEMYLMSLGINNELMALF